MRDEADCCQPTMSTSSIKYVKLKNGKEGPEYPINSKGEKKKNKNCMREDAEEYQRGS